MDYSLPCSSILWILQARILEWVATPVFPYQGDHPNPGIKHTSLMSPALASGFSITSATWHLESKAWVWGPFLLTTCRCQVPGLGAFLPTWPPATVSSPCSPFYLSGPAHSLSPRTETPLYRVKHPLPGPLSRLPQGEVISLLGLPKFHLLSPSSSMRMYWWPLSASDFQLECNFNKEWILFTFL